MSGLKGSTNYIFQFLWKETDQIENKWVLKGEGALGTLWRRTIWKFSILILSAVGASFYLMTELRTDAFSHGKINAPFRIKDIYLWVLFPLFEGQHNLKSDWFLLYWNEEVLIWQKSLLSSKVVKIWRFMFMFEYCGLFNESVYSNDLLAASLNNTSFRFVFVNLTIFHTRIPMKF